LAALLEGYLQQKPGLQQRFAQARITQKLQGTYLHLRQQRPLFSEPGLLKVGAGAVSVNPVTGMGVGNAMTMARIAAEQINRHWQQGRFEAGVEQQYARLVRQRLQPILRFNALLNAFQYKIHWLEPLLSPLLRRRWMQRLLQEPNWACQVNNPRFYWELLRRS
ncbi:MAG: hypothetical protein KDC44_09800, partial [Phaeodactylibacter sp.]|nr:hypothetical protein [Phaeodactylibacter sp.]